MKAGQSIEITQRTYKEVYSKKKGIWIQVLGDYQRFVVCASQTYPRTKKGALKVVLTCLRSDLNAGAADYVKWFIYELERPVFVDGRKFTAQELKNGIENLEERKNEGKEDFEL